LAGSATPALSIQDLIELSSDRQTTSSNLSVDSLKLSLGPPNGSEHLRQQIAGLYNEKITADNILATNGTTGANSLVFQSLLKPGDHVIAMYPSYTQLLSIPKATVGEDISYWSLDLNNQAQGNLQQLKDMIKTTTKMIVLNNPNNPLGTILSLEMQHEIVALVREYGLILVVDEIFRPLFHDSTNPPSFVELSEDNDKIIVTSSLSKAWGVSGTRVGWIATKNSKILSQCFDLGLYTIMAVGTIDEIIAAEALSSRCRPQILAKHLDIARKNLGLLESFVTKHEDISWIKPSSGATAFVRFSRNGAPVDDVDFCLELKTQKGVLLAPGSLCFGLAATQDFRGFVRMHITAPPEQVQAALEAIDEFLG
jgi:aspartate/methionine/tyrosine aminotransferase